MRTKISKYATCICNRNMCLKNVYSKDHDVLE